MLRPIDDEKKEEEEEEEEEGAGVVRRWTQRWKASLIKEREELEGG